MSQLSDRLADEVRRSVPYRLARAVKWHAIEVAVICVAAWEQRKGKR